MSRPALSTLRDKYHEALCSDLLSFREGTDSYNIADKHSAQSKAISQAVVDRMCTTPSAHSVSAQKSGEVFTRLTAKFLESSFALLDHLRPGPWEFSTSQAKPGIAKYDQYHHLDDIQELVSRIPEVKAALGSDYLITPDIVVARVPVEDTVLNQRSWVIEEGTRLIAARSPLRAANADIQRGVLHASVSCKWTMRSDRAQNTRTEALNLVRHRKGRTPHIVAVTCEPLPNRLASIALGTGDLDCTYHAALTELLDAVADVGSTEASETLNELVEGRRLRDISDLPLDISL